MPAAMATKSPQRIDVGDEFRDTSGDIGEYVIITGLFGIPELRVLKGFNLFSGLHANTDPSEYTNLLLQSIHPEDRPAFLEKVRTQRNLDDPEQLVKLVNLIVGAASGNPTTSSGGSSAGTPRKRGA